MQPISTSSGQPDKSADVDIENLRKKLIFRSWHRGTREMDIIMGRFAEAHVPHFSAQDLQYYDALLFENDPDVYNWIVGRETVPEHCQHDVMQKLIAFHNKL